jgi:hypothetical protein
MLEIDFILEAAFVVVTKKRMKLFSSVSLDPLDER